MDRRLARIERQLAEELQVARLPGCHPLTHTTILRVEMLGTTGKAGRHGDACLLERRLGNVAQESLVEGLQGLVSIGQHVPCRRLALIDAQVVVTIDQRTCQPREEDADLEFGHVGVTLDDAPLVGVAVQEQQAVLLAKGDAGLVEQSIIQSYILALSLRGNLHHLEGLQRDVVGLGKSHDVGYEHRST